MKGNRYTIALLSAIMVCLLAVPAVANYDFDGYPVQTRVSGTVEGGVFYDSAAWNGATTLTLNSAVPSGTVKYAYLYTGTWCGNPQNTGWVDVTFNGNGAGVFDSDGNELGPIYIAGENDNNPNVWCSGYGKSWWYYNVTDLVITGATNTATNSEISGSLDGRVYGIVLVVVYEGGDDPEEIQYWINDRSDGLNYATPHNTGTTDFAGTVDTGSIAEANLTMVHITGYSPACSDCLKFNDNTLDTSCVNSNTFEMNTWNVTNYVEASGNDAWYSRGDDGFVNICNGILVLHLGETGGECLGDCYEGTVCEGTLIAENMNCSECLAEAGRSWENYEFESPCNPGYMVPRLCYDYCPECCDGINNNDGDAYIDWPNDPECACCLDETEATDEGCPVPCVPELATLTLMGCGLGALFGLVKFKNRGKR